MNRLGMGLAVGAGYVLGRTKKMKLAFAVGTLVAGKKMQLNPRALADLVGSQLRNNPQFKEIGDQLRQDMRGVGKAASGALVERQIESIANRLHGRTAQMRDQISGIAPDVDVPGRGDDDEADEEYGEDEESREDEGHEDDSRDEERDEEPPPRKRAAAKKAPAKKAPAKKALAKKAPARKAPAKKAAADKPAARKSTERGAKKAPAKKTAAAKSTGRQVRGARLPKGGGDND